MGAVLPPRVNRSVLFQEKIEAINQTLVNEYEVRRKTLLKRLDVTVQSFGWSDKAKVPAHTKPQ